MSNERRVIGRRTIAIIAAIVAAVLVMCWVLFTLDDGLPTPVTALLSLRHPLI